jgi:hypothetical protein
MPDRAGIAFVAIHRCQSGGAGLVRRCQQGEFKPAAIGLAPERQPDGSPSADKMLEILATPCAKARTFEWHSRRLNSETFTAEVLATRGSDGQVFVR